MPNKILPSSRSSSKNFIYIGAIFFFLCIAGLFANCLIGQVKVTPLQFWSSLRDLWVSTSNTHQTSSIIIFQLRLPRGVLALLCGGSLALAGALLQGALRNPLADPFILGISAGAACGASIAIAFSHFGSLAMQAQVALCAFAGSALALFLTLFLAAHKGNLNRETVILAGIAVAAFLGAIVALIKALNEESVTSIVFWIMGSLQGATWQLCLVPLFCLTPGIAVALWAWRKLDVLALGDSQARLLGLGPARARLLILLGASCMTAGCVAVSGIIGFIGLVAPHVLRLLLGVSHGPLLASSFPVGGLLLLGADCLARSLFDNGQELPVGVVTALLGAPVFALIIWRQK